MPVNKDSQEARILNFFTFNQGESLTPPQVKIMVGLNCPLTSVRRALTMLTEQGKLRKTTETGEGLFGRTNHKWSLGFTEECYDQEERKNKRSEQVLHSHLHRKAVLPIHAVPEGR